MKDYLFAVIEWSITGRKHRKISVKAKSKQGAAKRIMAIKGNRDWDTYLIPEGEHRPELEHREWSGVRIEYK